MQQSEEIIKCNKGWKELYQPIVDDIITHDLSCISPEFKIGVKDVKKTNGYLDIKVFNSGNLNLSLIERIRKAQVLSEFTCEYCGTEKNVGTTSLTIKKEHCCKKCFDDIVKPKASLAIWKAN